MNDVYIRRFACKAWYTLNDEYTNMLNNDLPDNDACKSMQHGERLIDQDDKSLHDTAVV